MLKNEDVLLEALYTNPKLFQQSANPDREAAFAAVHDIVPDWNSDEFEAFYDACVLKYFSLMRVIDAAVRDSQIKEKIFSDDRVLAYTTAQSISMGYSENDFQQFMDQHADLAFQCLSSEFMATGNTPLDEESLAEVVGGSGFFNDFLDFLRKLKKISDPLESKEGASTKAQAVKARGLLPKLLADILRALGHCFIAGSLVATPEGSKPIEKIQVGDEVLGATEDGKIVTCRVKELLPPAEESIFTVRFQDGTVWHTTASQWFYTGTEFYSLLNIRDHTALTVQGTQVAIDEVVRTDRTETVYDFVVDGYNVMFINGIAAEGYSEE